MATPIQNFPINFIPNVPIYNPGTSSMNYTWVLFFQELWNRTGGNTNTTVTINDLITNQSSSGDVSQVVQQLVSQVGLLQAQDAFSVAIQALETAKVVSASADPMAYICLGVS